MVTHVLYSGVWKFFLASGVANTPAGFEIPEFSDDSWSDIVVPGHWQLQGAGALDPPIYTNTNYPFPNHPPYAPTRNPTGLYRRTFSVPSEWFAPRLEVRESGGACYHVDTSIEPLWWTRVLMKIGRLFRQTPR